MKTRHYILGLVILIAFLNTSCNKKKVFSSTTFGGFVYGSYTTIPKNNITIVLFKDRNSLLGNAQIGAEKKEIGRATTSADGSFSMKLKFLDKRDTYYVEITENNQKVKVTSNNEKFGYKALENAVSFYVY